MVDPKGELAQMTAEHRDPRAFDRTVIPEDRRSIFLNPFGVLDMRSDGFNPVAALDHTSPDFPDDALSLAEAMIRVEGHEPHWAASAQDLVAALIMYSRLTDSGGGSLAHVRDLLGLKPSDFQTKIELMLTTAREKECPELGVKAARYAEIDGESRELHAILSTALTQTRWLDSRPIKADLEKNGSLNFSVMKEKPTTVYLILPARRIATHATWMRVMIASIIRPLIQDTRKAKVPVLLMLDEYPALARGGFPIIEDNMAMFRGYGIKLWTVWQDLGQAEKLYGRGWESFVANAGVLQSFAPQDVVTAEYLSKRMPLTARSTETHTRNPKEGPDKFFSLSHGMNVGEQGMPLMLPQHLRNMDAGFSVVFSHKTKGPGRRYFPWKVQGLDDVYALDPS